MKNCEKCIRARVKSFAYEKNGAKISKMEKIFTNIPEIILIEKKSKIEIGNLSRRPIIQNGLK